MLKNACEENIFEFEVFSSASCVRCPILYAIYLIYQMYLLTYNYIEQQQKLQHAYTVLNKPL